MNRVQALEKRLDGYWKMECANILLVPAAMIFFASGKVGWLSAVALLPMCLLLAIGTYYWWAKLRYLQQREALRPRVSLLSRWEMPALVLTVVAVATTIAAWIWPALSTGLADRLVASSAATLAALEYVNYYHRQIQHFDHAADFRRLRDGRGFRKSQLRADLERFGLR